MRLLIAGLCLVWGSLALAGTPFTIAKQASFKKGQTPVLFESGGTFILANPGSKESEFRNLYVVRTPGWPAIPKNIAKEGDIVEFVPGEFAVMRIRPGRIEQVSGLLHEGGLACGGVFRLRGDPRSEIAPAVPEAILPIEQRDAFVQTMAEGVSADQIRQTIEELSALTTRYHQTDTGRGVAQLLVDKYQALVVDRDDVVVETYDHGNETTQDSLRVRIIGQTRPDEVIVLGSHIDSVNWRDGTRSRAPGADDNASGTATNFEIFRLLMENGVRLHRTLEIHGYAAEEVGLVGSQDMARRYRAAGVNVVAMVQHDMNLYKASGADDKIWFVTSNTLGGFNTLLGKLADHYSGLAWGTKSLSGGDSDHTSWTRQGFAAAFPFEDPSNYNRNIHTRHDTIANSGAFNQAAGFAKLGVAYVSHFGGVYR